MSDSKRELILKNIKESLDNIRVESGYETTLDNVQRWESEGNDLRNVPCVVIVPDDEVKSDENTWPEVNCTLPILLVFWFRHDKSMYSCSTDEILNKFLADIEKAVMSDPLRGGIDGIVTTRNLGNNSFETTEGQPYCGFIVRLEVFYKHKFDDPRS